MLKQILYFLTIACLLSSCGNDDVPDFSECVCPDVYEPVCGEDGRSYLNACYATCAGATIQDSSNCDSTHFVASDTLTWPIAQVCFPIAVIGQLISDRADGTQIYQHTDGTYYRAFTFYTCLCLPPQTKIATPMGELKLSSLLIGDKVWSVDENGNRFAAPVLKINKVQVPSTHQVLQICLEDGRELQVSPLHPDANGNHLQTYRAGDILDNSVIQVIDLIPYTGSHTMDLLPEGTTGTYYANGILIGSTLLEGTEVMNEGPEDTE